METKQMAHEYALKLIAVGGHDGTFNMDRVATLAWHLTDRMEAEAAKRIDTSPPEAILNAGEYLKHGLKPVMKMIDWERDAPEWANFLFYDSITLAPTWAENAPVETSPLSFADRCAITCAPGRSRRAGVAYLWVNKSGTVHERPAHA